MWEELKHNLKKGFFINLILAVQFAVLFWQGTNIASYFLDLPTTFSTENIRGDSAYYSLHYWMSSEEDYQYAGNVSENPDYESNQIQVLAELRSNPEYHYMAFDGTQGLIAYEELEGRFSQQDLLDFYAGSEYPGSFRPEETPPDSLTFSMSGMNLLEVNCFSIDQAAMEEYRFQVSDGQLFGEEDFLYRWDQEEIPVLLGHAYGSGFQPGDVIRGFTYSIPCRFRVVGILEKGFFHDLEDNRYFSLEQFNRDLWSKLDALNHENFKKKDYSRYDRWIQERPELLPLPSVHYEYMERRTAKVSGDFHIRFDNAYYSVDKAYLHKSVMVAATASTVNIYSMKGELIVRWRRATRRGEWLTDPSHLPESYKQMSEWNAAYFTRKAMTVGPNTVKVIEHILKSREHEVQTYRLCLGILNYTKKYSKLALEDCCRLAIETNHISYSFIKNSIAAVAEEIGTAGFNTKLNEERNKGAFVMSPHAGDIEHLLKKSSKLAGEVRDEEA